MRKAAIALLVGILFMIPTARSIAQTNSAQWTYAYQGGVPAYRSLSLQNYGIDGTAGAYQYHTYPSSGWLNHPPAPVYTPTRPMITKAGQTATWAFGVIDPDADWVYASSGIGATGQPGAGITTWSFTPNFPGVYMMNSMVYDERGGFALMRSPVVVKPWWSF